MLQYVWPTPDTTTLELCEAYGVQFTGTRNIVAARRASARLAVLVPAAMGVPGWMPEIDDLTVERTSRSVDGCRRGLLR